MITGFGGLTFPLGLALLLRLLLTLRVGREFLRKLLDAALGYALVFPRVSFFGRRRCRFTINRSGLLLLRGLLFALNGRLLRGLVFLNGSPCKVLLRFHAAGSGAAGRVRHTPQSYAFRRSLGFVLPFENVENLPLCPRPTRKHLRQKFHYPRPCLVNVVRERLMELLMMLVAQFEIVNPRVQFRVFGFQGGNRFKQFPAVGRLGHPSPQLRPREIARVTHPNM
jgi:hypothetical protein